MEFINGVRIDNLIEKYGSPLYVYDESILKNQFIRLKKSLTYPKTEILYACKANTNISIMKSFQKIGAWLDAVSPWEIECAYRAGFQKFQILYTGDNVTDEEMKFCLDQGIQQNLGSLSQIDRYGKINPCSDICVRINPDCGSGHHSHTITGGPESKFGIYFDKIDQIKSLSKKYSLKIVGLHSHIGSGILDVNELINAVDIILNTAVNFKDLEFIDIGGGIGVPYKIEEKDIDIEFLGKAISDRFNKFSSNYQRNIYLYLEPGRFLVAQCGFLLMKVNNLKRTPKYYFAGTDSGFNHLIRPMAYGSYHEIVNCSNPNGPMNFYTISGNICESGDIFTQNNLAFEGRKISKIREGDILAIKNAGAYCFSMSSNYNMRPRPAEVMISNSKDHLIRRREVLTDLISSMEI